MVVWLIELTPSSLDGECLHSQALQGNELGIQRLYQSQRWAVQGNLLEKHQRLGAQDEQENLIEVGRAWVIASIKL